MLAPKSLRDRIVEKLKDGLRRQDSIRAEVRNVGTKAYEDAKNSAGIKPLNKTLAVYENVR